MTMTTDYQVRDGQRILKFRGTHLGFSTSQRPDAIRWIEFRLFKTEGGQYVLSRIGFSRLYHMPDCEIAERSKLDETNRAEILPDDVPCDECRPDRVLPEDMPFVSFEREKHWARVYASAEDVLEGLMKVDIHSGNKYMTAVARRLLEDAGTQDDDLYNSTNVETID